MLLFKKGLLNLCMLYIYMIIAQNIYSESQLPTPILSTKDTVFMREINIKITVPESCIVYFTTNLNIPTRNDDRYYNGSILTIDTSVTITAKAFRFYSEVTESSNVRWEDGGVVVAKYTKKLQEPYAQLIPYNNDSNIVTIYSYDRDNIKLYYTTDGSNPDTLSYQYFQPPLNSTPDDLLRLPKSQTLKVIAYKTGSITSAVLTIPGEQVNITHFNKISKSSVLHRPNNLILLNGKSIKNDYFSKVNTANLIFTKGSIKIKI